MSNSITVFDNYQFGKIRSIQKDGEPWFVAVDVCNALDLSNTTMVIDRLDADERAKFNLGRQGEAWAVNEYGLYNLILASRKEEAKAFKRWITHEVIPAIRKTGAYAVTPPEQINYKRLPSTNHAASILMRAYKMAGANTVSLASTIAAMYRGLGVPVPALEAPQQFRLLTSEQIAAIVGLFSESGRPHSQAIGAIVRDCDIPDEMVQIMTFERNGHSGTTVQYREEVVGIIRDYLERFPNPEIEVNGRRFKVYRR